MVDAVDKHEHDQEEMEMPGAGPAQARTTIIGVVAIVGVAALVLSYVLLSKNRDDDKGLGLEVETIETIDETQRLKSLRLPKDKKSLAKQLANLKATPTPAPSEPDQSVADRVEAQTRQARLEQLRQQAASTPLPVEPINPTLVAIRQSKRTTGNDKDRKKSQQAWLKRQTASMDDASNNSNTNTNGAKQRQRPTAPVMPTMPQMPQFGQSLLQAPGGASRLKTAGVPNALIAIPVSETETVTASTLPNQDWLLTSGTIIHAVLETAINSDLPGYVRALISQPVYSFTGNLIVIPASSELHGQYQRASGGGDPRVFIIWNRVITPDGISIQIDSPGADKLGRSGTGGWTDTHFAKRFGSSILLSIVGGASQAASSNDNQRRAVSEAFSRSAEIALENTINISPTIHINHGERIAVILNKDLDFKAAMIATGAHKHRRPNATAQRPSIGFDRVFDARELSPAERAMLANRYLQQQARVSTSPAGKVRPYSAMAGASLRATIKHWASLSAYQTNWTVSDTEGNTLDWSLATDVHINGSLFDAIARLLAAYNSAGVLLRHTFYQQNKVLVIQYDS